MSIRATPASLSGTYASKVDPAGVNFAGPITVDGVPVGSGEPGPQGLPGNVEAPVGGLVLVDTATAALGLLRLTNGILVVDTPYTAPAGFTDLNDLPNLRSLFVADDLNAATDGSAVTSWAERAGDGNTLVQATADRQPALDKTAFSRSTVYFDGTADMADESFSGGNPTAFTLYAVVALPTGAQAGGDAMVALTTAAGGDDYSVGYTFGAQNTGSPPTAWDFFLKEGAKGTTNSLDPGAALNELVLITLNEPASGNRVIRFNGVQAHSSAASAAAIGAGRLYLGARYYASDVRGPRGRMRMGLHAFCDASHDADTMTAAEALILDYYGIG